MEELKGIKIFVIKRFIITIILVSAVEYVNLIFIRRTLLSLIVRIFFTGQNPDEVSAYGIFAGTIYLIFLILLEVISGILPQQIRVLATSGIENLEKLITKTLISSSNSVALEKATLQGKLILFLILIAIVFLILVPVVVAALYFSSIVIKEFRKIEEEETRKQKEYDMKRNLMLSDIAHDLRTPITTISGYAMALSDGMVEEEKKQEYLTAIQTKSKRMSDLINLLFDYVKLDSASFKLNKEKCDICELVREAVAFQYQDIEDANMTLDVDIPENSIYLDVDKLQFSRVITNLITNAVKHNPSGTGLGVFLVIDNEDDSIRIMVADTGEKIPEESANNIFDPFIMGDESRNSKGGTGLGLSISRKIVEMHRYSISLKQRPAINNDKLLSNYQKAFIIKI